MLSIRFLREWGFIACFNSLDISISSECYEVKPKQQTSEELVMADIGGYQSTKIYKTTKQWLVDHEII